MFLRHGGLSNLVICSSCIVWFFPCSVRCTYNVLFEVLSKKRYMLPYLIISPMGVVFIQSLQGFTFILWVMVDIVSGLWV